MSHFVFVSDDDDVLGVWEAQSEVAALRMRLSLQLTYPGCTTHQVAADDFEAMKERSPELDFGHFQPDLC